MPMKLQPTLVLGLGAAGRTFTENLKKRISDAYGDLSAVKLLAVDVPGVSTTVKGGAAERSAQSILGPTEHLELPVDDVTKSAKAAREHHAWLSDQVIKAGENWIQSRAVARLGLHSNFRDIQSFVEFHLHTLNTIEVRDQMASKGFEMATERSEAAVYVFADSGETAGSALLLDMTYLVHSIYQHTGTHVASSAIVLLPPIAPRDASAEANAYAVLKELNDVMEKRAYVSHFPGLRKEFDYAPFNNGIHLIENRNERNLALKSKNETIMLCAEWLFRIMLTPLKGQIDNFISTQDITARVQNKAACYTSFGMAVYLLPIDDLIEFCSTRLSYELLGDQVLVSELFKNVSQRLVDFFTRTNLRPDDLREKELGVRNDGRPIQRDEGVQSLVNGLKSVPLDQIQARYVAATAALKNQVPNIKKQIEAKARDVLDRSIEVVNQEVTSILRDFPKGGLSLATQFTRRLQSEFSKFEKVLNRREVAIRAKNQNEEIRLRSYAEGLEHALQGKPALWMVLIYLLGGFAAPATLFTIGIWRWLPANTWILKLILTIVLWLVAAGGAVLAYFKTINSIEQVRDKYIIELYNRFQADVGLTLVQTARTLYPEIMSTLQAKLSNLETVTESLKKLSRTLRKRLDIGRITGDIGFALQRSILTEDSTEALYNRYLGSGGAESRLLSLIKEIGTMDTWLDKPVDEVESALLSYGDTVFKPMRDLKVEELFNKEASDQKQAEARMAELNDKAMPLISFDQFVLGQTANTQHQSFVGLDSIQSSFHKYFGGVNPNAIFEQVGDPYSFFVTTVRRGLPIFCLRRSTEFRQNYLDWVKDGNISLHLEDELALTPDVMVDETETIEMQAATAFSVGCALGLVSVKEGVYSIQNRDGKLKKKLGKDKVNSIILLSSEPKVINQLAADIQADVSEKGSTAAVDFLNGYIQNEDLWDWEVNRIKEYIGLLKG